MNIPLTGSTLGVRIGSALTGAAAISIAFNTFLLHGLPAASSPLASWSRAGLACLLFAGCAAVLLRRLLQPLRSLSQATRPNFASRSAVGSQPSGDEVGQLADTLGLVTSQLAELLRREAQRADVLELGHRESQARCQTMEEELVRRDRAWEALNLDRARLADRVRERSQELSAAQSALARSTRAKDEFLASMSHELRTPLHAILGLTEALREKTHGPLTKDQERFLGDVEASGRNLLAVINDILDVVRISSANLELDVKPVPVDTLCKASLTLIRQAAAKKQLEVISVVDASAETVEADGRRLKQILFNLLTNAVKFTPPHGRIRLEVTPNPAEARLRFSVIDSGIGISTEDQSLLFQPFVQLDSRLAREYEGTGLGLSLVYQMTKLHGGTVEVASASGAGSRFTVALPWSPPAATAQVVEIASRPLPAADKVRRVGAPRILIAEDNQANVAALRACLEGRGYPTIVASTGPDALTLARERRPALILMDVQLPGCSGLEVTQALRDDPAMREVAVVALTALALPGDRERCLAAGMDDYLAKPVRLADLVATVETQLTRCGRRQKLLHHGWAPAAAQRAAH